MTAARADTGEIPPALPVGRAATDPNASEAEEPVGDGFRCDRSYCRPTIVEQAKELLMTPAGHDRTRGSGGFRSPRWIAAPPRC